MDRQTYAVYQTFRQRPYACAQCGEPTGEPVRLATGGRLVDGWGNQTTYCSNRCKQKAYRQRRKALQEWSAP